MAVVKDYISQEGCHVIVHDDCYKSKSPREVERIIEHVSLIILREDFYQFKQKQGEILPKTPNMER